MFDTLTQTELEELSDKLDSAIYTTSHETRYTQPALLSELRSVQHEAWHTYCTKSGCRCLHHAA